MRVFCDNQAAVILAKNPAAGAHNRTKHVDVRFQFARQRVIMGDVTVSFCPTGKMVADILTKQLAGPAYKMHCKSMGLMSPSGIKMA